MDELNHNVNASEPQVSYTEENIRHLSDMEHVRTRPGMYIGRLGDGSQAEDGILSDAWAMAHRRRTVYMCCSRKWWTTVSTNSRWG